MRLLWGSATIFSWILYPPFWAALAEDTSCIILMKSNSLEVWITSEQEQQHDSKQLVHPDPSRSGDAG